PGAYLDDKEGARYARVRLEAEQAQRRLLEVRGHVARLFEGARFTLTDAPEGLEGEYLVTSVVHGYGAVASSWLEAASLRGDETAETHLSMRATLLSVDVPFRLLSETPKPVVEGFQTATV